MRSNKKILVTGGCGYIGSHTVLSLLENGFDVIALDNLVNGCEEALHRISALTGKAVSFINIDVTNKALIDEVFESYNIDAVLHFAGYKAVGESVSNPIDYYKNNVMGTLTLLESMLSHNVNRFIFSSSATVYGEEAPIPYRETHPLGSPSSPYGTSKVMVEKFLADLKKAHPQLQAVSLRYFNPIGAHQSGLIGEDPKGVPNNLMPFIAQVAVQRREQLSIFGRDYPTEDGTCERDFIHVMDLAEGHVAALKWLVTRGQLDSVEAFNLGTGKACSVLNLVKSFERLTKIHIPFKFESRRAGDLPAFWADPSKANKLLNWRASRTLDAMIVDTWNWQRDNPDGYCL